MQLIIDIKNDSLAKKIISILNAFRDDGVVIRQATSDKRQPKREMDDRYIKEHWRELGMNTHSAELDDDERLFEAAERFYSEKHSN